ncbi:hypothetical protein C8J57DRAFT_1524687 [Mycena rebaudengoi]|nr:hypothetical protein C8J57DRAFT_1524687 [Mycena rebaudengoi]
MSELRLPSILVFTGVVNDKSSCPVDEFSGELYGARTQNAVHPLEVPPLMPAYGLDGIHPFTTNSASTALSPYRVNLSVLALGTVPRFLSPLDGHQFSFAASLPRAMLISASVASFDDVGPSAPICSKEPTAAPHTASVRLRTASHCPLKQALDFVVPPSKLMATVVPHAAHVYVYPHVAPGRNHIMGGKGAHFRTD